RQGAGGNLCKSFRMGRTVSDYLDERRRYTEERLGALAEYTVFSRTGGSNGGMTMPRKKSGLSTRAQFVPGMSPGVPQWANTRLASVCTGPDANHESQTAYCRAR